MAGLFGPCAVYVQAFFASQGTRNKEQGTIYSGFPVYDAVDVDRVTKHVVTANSKTTHVGVLCASEASDDAGECCERM
jgi:hypothetical protein